VSSHADGAAALGAQPEDARCAHYAEAPGRPPGELRMVLRRLARDWTALVGLLVVGLALIAGLLAPWIAPWDPNHMQTAIRLAPPGTAGHVLGTEHLGRDVLSRVIWGARLSLAAGFLPVLLALPIGFLPGVVAGYFGGRPDTVVMRVIEIFQSFPAILLAIGLVSALGPGLGHAMLAMTVVSIPTFARLARGSVLSIKEREFVEAARASGAGHRHIIVRHVVPNVIAPVLVYATLECGRMMIFAAGLSFLGLGVQPPAAEWGAMLAEGRTILGIAPHVATVSGLAIFAVTLGLNWLGDGLRDALDPRL
jgi:peptide/nickel transport system permease protein